MRTVSLFFIILILLAGCTLPTTETPVEEVLTGGTPVVTIYSPLPNTAFLEGVPVNIQASISNAGQDISQVDIQVDGESIAALQSPNTAGATVFSITQTWPTAGLGEHTITVIAERGDGTTSDPASVTISVVEPLAPATFTAEPTATEAQVESPEPAATEADSEPTEAEPTDPPTPEEPTEIPASPTPNVPTARFNSGINVRSGPGTNFNPPIGQFAANQTTEILALNPSGSWLKVRYGNGEGWVLAQLVDIDGEIGNLPREVGPPTPIPPTATPIPATATPAVTNNLVPIEPFIAPPVPNCGQPFSAGMTIRNDGSGSLSTGISRVRIIRASDGTEIANSGTAGVAVTLQPGGTHRVEFPFTVDVFVGEVHRVEFIADADNQVAETIETDNMITVDYTLPANCG